MTMMLMVTGSRTFLTNVFASLYDSWCTVFYTTPYNQATGYQPKYTDSSVYMTYTEGPYQFVQLEIWGTNAQTNSGGMNCTGYNIENGHYVVEKNALNTLFVNSVNEQGYYGSYLRIIPYPTSQSGYACGTWYADYYY